MLEKDEFLKTLKSNYYSTTTNCSEICRKIAFALTAVVWAIMFKSDYGENWQFEDARIVLLLLVIYFLIDFLQYFLIAVLNRRHYKEIKKKGEAIFVEEQEITKQKRYNNISYGLFLIKSVFLLLSFVGMLLVIVFI